MLKESSQEGIGPAGLVPGVFTLTLPFVFLPAAKIWSLKPVLGKDCEAIKTGTRCAI